MLDCGAGVVSVSKVENRTKLACELAEAGCAHQHGRRVDAKALRPGLRLTQDQVRAVGLTPRPSRIGSSDVALPIGLRIGFGEERPHWLRELVVQSGPNRRVPLLKRLADLLFRSPTEPPCYLV